MINFQKKKSITHKSIKHNESQLDLHFFLRKTNLKIIKKPKNDLLH